MGIRRNAKIFGLLLSVALVLSLTSACFAADNGSDFNRFGVRLRALYLIPHQRNDLGVKVQDAVAPELDLEYFFTKNFSTELVLALTKHDIEAGGKTVASTWLLPPSLLFKVHPFPKAKISPYAGVGLNVVMPFDEKDSLGLNLKVHTSVGVAAQVGADIPITKNVFFNIDGKYYSTITHVSSGHTNLGGLRVSPFIIGTGLGVRF